MQAKFCVQDASIVDLRRTLFKAEFAHVGSAHELISHYC